MARAARTHPILASDIWRSIIAWLIGSVIGFAAAFLLGYFGALAGVEYRALILAAGFLNWTAFVVVLILLTVLALARADATSLARWMRETTPRPVLWRRFLWACVGGGAVPLAVTVSAITIIGLITIATTQGLRGSPVIIGSGVAVAIASLASIIVGFAVRYAREDATRGGFVFPGEAAPTFAHYFYLAVQVTTTYSASDVSIVQSNSRIMVSVHALIAFLFNTVIVALFVAVLLNAVTGSG